MEEETKFLAFVTEGKRPFGRHRLRREVNIKMNIKQTGCDDVDSSGSGQ
jgi:hypothetical protein